MATITFLQRFATRARLVASDSWSLASTLVKVRPTSVTSTRAALIQSARESVNGNIVAESALRLDREVGLMRYHGFGSYVAAKGGVRALLLPSDPSSGESGGEFNLTRFLFGPPSGHGREATSASATDTDSTSTGSSSKSTGATSSAKKARVAFMITAAQRQQLSTVLGYTAGDIRSLKPLEALLILEHRIMPGSDEEVKRLVKENEELERQEAERAETDVTASAAADEVPPATAAIKEDIFRSEGNTAISAGKDTNQDKTSPLLEDQNNNSGLSLSSSISDQSVAVQQALSRPLSSNQSDDFAEHVPTYDNGTTGTANTSEGDDTTWYEVVEAKAQGNSDEAVVALYQTVEEAKDCLKWKYQRGRGEFTYQIRERTF